MYKTLEQNGAVYYNINKNILIKIKILKCFIQINYTHFPWKTNLLGIRIGAIRIQHSCMVIDTISFYDFR